MRQVPLHVLAVDLEVVREGTVAVHVRNYGLPVVAHLPDRTVSQLKLMREVVDVPLEGVNLLDVVLLSRLHLPQAQLCSVDLLLESLCLDEDLFVLLAYLNHGLLQTLALQACAAVSSQHIVFFQFQRTKALLRKSLPVNEVLGVLPQVFVGLSRLCELRVHELVFSGERLDVLRKLAALGGLRLRELGLLLQLLPQQCDLLP